MDAAMREKAIRAALAAAGYSPAESAATAADLMEFSGFGWRDLACAVDSWLAGARPVVSEGELTTDSLMREYGMSYPASLVMIGWLRSDPGQARRCLKAQG